MTPRVERRGGANFVQREVLAQLVSDEDNPERLSLRHRAIYLQGFGGVGKSEVLRALARRVTRAGWRTAWIDGRLVTPSPAGVCNALAVALGAGSFAEAQASLADDPVLLVVDAFERINSLWVWLCEELLPALPRRWSLVFAGRWRPPQSWRGQARLAGSLAVVPLGNFTLAEARQFLAGRGIAAEHHDAWFAHTYGHPLALVLACELIDDPQVFTRQGFGASVGLVQGLLDEFRLTPTTNPRELRALMTCALARRTTEGLLRHVLDEEHARPLFDWLRRLSFIEVDARGLYPHDLVRDALIADLEWRDRELRDELFDRTRDYTIRRLEREAAAPEVVIDALHLIGHIDGWQTRVAPRGLEMGDIGPATPAEWPEIAAMVRRHEGESSLGWLCFWRERGAHILSLRDASGSVVGMLGYLDLHNQNLDEAALDPGVAPVRDYLARRPPRPGGRVVYYRFWMGRDAYQSPSPELTRCLVHVVQLAFLTPRLAFLFAANHDPKSWIETHPHDPTEICIADFTIDGHDFGVFCHDLRERTALDWYEANVNRAAAKENPWTALTREQTLAAIRRALRVIDRPDLLRDNPLVCAGLVTYPRGNDPRSREERAEALSELLRRECQQLLRSPHDRDLYRVVHHTFFQSSGKQERVASELAMSFATYRRRLSEATRRLADRLWQRQQHAAGRAASAH